jgi:hypothetical protein
MIKHNVSPADLDERFVGLLSAEKPKSGGSDDSFALAISYKFKDRSGK